MVGELVKRSARGAAKNFGWRQPAAVAGGYSEATVKGRDVLADFCEA